MTAIFWWFIPTASRMRKISSEEMFGEERLLELIRQAAPAGSHVLEHKLLRAIEEFTQGTPQTDDITFVIVEKTAA